jgi:hypothetical protein
MHELRKLHPKAAKHYFCLFALWFGLASAQGQQAGESPAPTQPAKASPAETHISPAEAQELFRSVDDILKFASKQTGLPVKHRVKRQLTSRDAVEAFIQKGMEDDKDAQRLRRSELVLKKFGLLPQDFDMQKFLVALLREQIAGYYDPKTKTVNLLDWIDAVQQRPVLAHELTHALQDQSFNLGKWMLTEDPDDKKSPRAADIASDEASLARQSVIEGQATAVLINYMLAPSGQSLQSSPQIVEALKAGMLVGGDDSVELRKAPGFIRESLTFPYRYGLDFEVALMIRVGREKAFSGPFQNPPVNTRQIMEPNTYLSGEHIPPMPVPDLRHIFKNYERFDIGSIGEFDVAMLVEQYVGAEKSHAVYPNWRGGYYYAAKLKSDPAAPLGLFYLSRWSDPEHAGEFAAIYAGSLAKRYKHVHAAVGDAQPQDDLGKLTTLDGTHTWITEDGPVVIEVRGDTVFVVESLDTSVEEQLEQAIFSLQ